MLPSSSQHSRMAAIDLIYAAHGALLRDLAECSGRHFQGLAQAARHFSSSLSSRQRRHLLNMDAAFNVVRHVTRPKIDTEHASILSAVRSSVCRAPAVVGVVAGVSTSDDSAAADSPSWSPCSASPALFDIFDVRSDSASQTEVSMANALVSGDPDVLVSIAVNNACASLAADVQVRAEELDALAGDPLPPDVGLCDGLLPSVPGDVPVTFLDVVAVDECRRLMARLLVSWNRLATEIKSLANPVDYDLYDTFLSNFTLGLVDFLKLSKMGDSCLMIDFVVVADHVASQVVFGCDGWLAHLASSHCTLASWNLDIFDERLNLLSYFLARFVVAFDEAVFAFVDADG